MPRKLKFNVNVGNVNNTSYLGHNTGDDVYERGDHFAVCFYHTDTNTLVYGDSFKYMIFQTMLSYCSQTFCVWYVIMT